ncbi:MAG TPA: hypothetical protein VF548_02720 [Allosphingosinicella sp.]|jgi:hypothetical protein
MSSRILLAAAAGLFAAGTAAARADRPCPLRKLTDFDIAAYASGPLRQSGR